MSIGERFCLSFSTQTHRKWSSVHTPAGFCSTLKPPGTPATVTETATPDPVMAAGFSSVPITCLLFYSPFFANIPLGQWGLQFTQTCFCFSGSKQKLRLLQDTAEAASSMEGFLYKACLICQGQHFTVRKASKRDAKKDN